MAISLISHNHVATSGVRNSFSISVSANTGDVIEFTLQYGDNSGATFTPVWNGQSFTALAARVSAGGFFFHRFYLIAASTTTANVTGGTSPTYALLNYGYKVWRSGAFATPPFKAGSYQASNYTSGSFTNPSLTNTLASGEVVSAVLATSGWDTGFGTGTGTFTDNAPSVSIGQCENTPATKIKYLRSLYTTGTGSVTTALTKTGAHNPMYQFSTVILQETAYLITSINGGNPITAGQTGIPIVASGFTAKPTAVTATYASGAKSITATIDSGGTATNFNISIQDRIEAEDWPINGDTLTFTFTYLSESASGTQTLVKKATETVLNFSGAITSDPATLTYWLTQDGFTVEGGEMAYEQPPATGTMPTPDLVLTPDGGGSVKEACQFNSWFRPSTGTGAGNAYFYRWTVTADGVVVSVTKFIGSTIKGRILTGSLLKGKLL